MAGCRRPDRDRGRALDRVVDALERDPGPREPRHRDPEQAVLQDLLHAGRVQDRHHRVDHRVLALVRGGRALADVVVAEQQQHAAQGRRAEQVAVPDRVAASGPPPALAVPDREHALEAALALQARLLRSLAGGGGEVLVHARLVDDLVLREQPARPLELLVVAAERRPAVARDVAGRVPPRREIPATLLERQPYQRLHAGHEHPALGEPVLVVEHHVAQLRHYRPRPDPPARAGSVLRPTSLHTRPGDRARGQRDNPRCVHGLVRIVR